MHYDPSDLPHISGQTPIAEIFPSRKVMPALHMAGCNLRCHYCLNRDLIDKKCPQLDPIPIINEHIAALEPWLMISGAEPLLNSKTPNLLFRIKSLGMRVALATNGTCFEKLKLVVEEGLVDHISMDVKAPLDLERYSEVSSVGINSNSLRNIKKSIDFLKNYPYNALLSRHFRTTVCAKYIGFNDLRCIADCLGKDSTYVLQYYTIHQTLDPCLAQETYQTPYEQLVEWSKRLSCFVEHVFVSEV